ncbi:hypothetical protein CHARACLAT_012352 [Characodon lateralis]|uniref:Uncharacterized protein n=1 Tax=Characodon lateralis TaxID=208331 RepID=A0ABU7CRP7_9TELE|nr:hypothetical protein [Characodon lateralis]
MLTADIFSLYHHSEAAAFQGQRTAEEKQADLFQIVAERLSVYVLLPVAEARQSPGASAAKAPPVGTGAASPAQAGQRKTAEPGTKKAAAPLPKVPFGSGKYG